MATHHAEPNEVIDLEKWASDMPIEKTKVIIKTKEMELARLVIPAGQTFKEHRVSGPITVHCIKGSIQFTAKGVSQELKPGQMLYLNPGELHSLDALTDSIILLTIIFER